MLSYLNTSHSPLSSYLWFDFLHITSQEKIHNDLLLAPGKNNEEVPRLKSYNRSEHRYASLSITLDKLATKTEALFIVHGVMEARKRSSREMQSKKEIDTSGYHQLPEHPASFPVPIPSP